MLPRQNNEKEDSPSDQVQDDSFCLINLYEYEIPFWTWGCPEFVKELWKNKNTTVPSKRPHLSPHMAVDH
jgi:hypothetical protein